MTIKEQLKEWFKELIFIDKPIENYFMINPELYGIRKNVIEDFHKFNDDNVIVYFFTKDHKYLIRASPDYLGCDFSARKERTGEDWNRGWDLPNGEFNEETWTKIKNAIIMNEIVKVVRKDKERLLEQ